MFFLCRRVRKHYGNEQLKRNTLSKGYKRLTHINHNLQEKQQDHETARFIIIYGVHVLNNAICWERASEHKWGNPKYNGFYSLAVKHPVKLSLKNITASIYGVFLWSNSEWEYLTIWLRPALGSRRDRPFCTETW